MTHRFTVKDYHRMAEADIFDPEDRVELRWRSPPSSVDRAIVHVSR
jgi:hypothetical protein